MMENVERRVSFQTFEHVSCSVDSQQRGNLNMWSVVLEYDSLMLYMHTKVVIFNDSPRLVKAPLDKLNLESKFTAAVKQE